MDAEEAGSLPVRSEYHVFLWVPNVLGMAVAPWSDSSARGRGLAGTLPNDSTGSWRPRICVINFAESVIQLRKHSGKQRFNIAVHELVALEHFYVPRDQPIKLKTANIPHPEELLPSEGTHPRVGISGLIGTRLEATEGRLLLMISLSAAAAESLYSAAVLLMRNHLEDELFSRDGKGEPGPDTSPGKGTSVVRDAPNAEEFVNFFMNYNVISASDDAVPSTTVKFRDDREGRPSVWRVRTSKTNPSVLKFAYLGLEGALTVRQRRHKAIHTLGLMLGLNLAWASQEGVHVDRLTIELGDPSKPELRLVERQPASESSRARFIVMILDSFADRERWESWLISHGATHGAADDPSRRRIRSEALQTDTEAFSRLPSSAVKQHMMSSFGSPTDVVVPEEHHHSDHGVGDGAPAVPPSADKSAQEAPPSSYNAWTQMLEAFDAVRAVFAESAAAIESTRTQHNAERALAALESTTVSSLAPVASQKNSTPSPSAWQDNSAKQPEPDGEFRVPLLFGGASPFLPLRDRLSSFTRSLGDARDTSATYAPRKSAVQQRAPAALSTYCATALYMDPDEVAAIIESVRSGGGAQETL